MDSKSFGLFSVAWVLNFNTQAIEITSREAFRKRISQVIEVDKNYFGPGLDFQKKILGPAGL